MNRAILFRGQRFDTKEFIEGFYFITPLTDGITDSTPDSSWSFLTGKTRHVISRNNCVYQIIPETVGEYSGFKDKGNSGKTIFEGDIFKHDSKKNVYGVVVIYLGQWIVNFEDHQVPLYQYLINNTKREICGNIHDNPELHVFF